jgi:hypothetical protein
MYRRLLLGFAMVFFLTQRTSSLLADDLTTWVVAESSGRVLLSPDILNRVSLTQGDQIAPGSHIRTMDDGRAILMHGEDVIIISPNSELLIPTSQPEFGTRLLQTIGRAMYKVTKRSSPHFEVDTPYLAATVKGTTFEVTSDPSGSAVHVVEGRVQVRAVRDGRSELVRTGQIARVSSVPGITLQIESPPTMGGGNRNGSGSGKGNGSHSSNAGTPE